MMSEGTSLDWLDTCILAMPRANVVAAGRAHPPRVSRQGAAGGDGRYRHRQPGVPGYAASRLKWFKSIGCEIKDM